MLTLHGFDASNYVNMVKFALLEKGIPFEQATLYPAQEEPVLAVSGLGSRAAKRWGQLLCSGNH